MEYKALYTQPATCSPAAKQSHYIDRPMLKGMEWQAREQPLSLQKTTKYLIVVGIFYEIFMSKLLVKQVCTLHYSNFGDHAGISEL